MSCRRWLCKQGRPGPYSVDLVQESIRRIRSALVDFLLSPGAAAAGARSSRHHESRKRVGDMRSPTIRTNRACRRGRVRCGITPQRLLPVLLCLKSTTLGRGVDDIRSLCRAGELCCPPIAMAFASQLTSTEIIASRRRPQE